MNSKRIISLILSILMTLQVFAFQTPVNAMEGVNPTIQKSEGQKIGKRSEVFEFKNNEKPNWFYTRRRSLFGARDVGLTKSEKVKIETTATGLGEGEFNWEAFGQNRKFEAWIEVAYADDVNKEGEPIRHKVSKDFEINKAGTIDTNITVDASKTVENYFIVTEYDEEPDSFNINAFFDRTTIKSDKGEKSIAFKLDVHQIISTKITYNLIDEYGKAIDLKDAKEAKPADTDLKNLGKLGNGTDDPVATFNLKNYGTEILWETEGLDEFELMSSSLALSLTENQITSDGIDYKLTSTYDVINGGTVTIQRQKDVVTPKDPKNPGNKPEGYARINLVADETGNGSKGTFTKDNPQDTQRVVDVRAGKPYTKAQTEIDKQAKPFPLTSENKVDTGKTFKAWDPELNTLGNAVADETKTLHATYQTSKEEIIPYLPGEEVPTKDKDGLPIPTDYVNITFNSESESKGKVKIGDKEGSTVLAKVKPGIDLSQKTEIKTVPEEHYGFTQWKPVLGKAAEGQTYTAYFVKSGEEIGEKDPIPEGWFKVTVSQDDDSIVANTVKKAVYPVEPNGKLASDKFADLTNKAKDGYKDPAWYVGSDKVEKPYEVVINSAIDFVARATELESHKITKKNGLRPVDITAYKGDEMVEGFWKKGVELKTSDENLQKLLDAATVADATTPARTTDEAGEKVGTLKVTFSDGSTIEVQDQKLIVIDTKVDIDYDKESDKDANAPRHKDEVVKGKIKSDEALEGAKVEILDKDNKVIGITLAKADGSFIAGTRELQAGETIKVRVTLPKAGKASEPVEKVVKLNADRLKDLLPIAKTQKKNFSKKQNAIIKEKLEALGTAITEAEKLVDKNGKAIGEDTAKNQTAIDSKVKALEEALKALTANIPPSISGPKTHEIFVGEALDLEKLVDVTDGDGADDLVVENGSNVKITVVKVEGQAQTPVADLSKINETVGTYKVTYTAKDKSNAEVTHEMTLTVKPRTTSAIEVTKDPTNMSYLITEKNGKAKLNLDGMTLNLVDNLGKKTKVELTDPKVKFKVNGKEIKDGGDLKLEDDVKFIEVEYTPEGSQTPLKAQTKGVLRVGPDYDNDGTDDRTQNFDPKNIEKLVVIKQPQLDYIAKDKSEDSKFKLNLEGMIVRMTDKAGKEKLAVFNEGKFVDYDNIREEIKGLTATPVNGAKLTPQTSDTDKGHNGSKVAITGPNNSKAETEPLKVFYDANKDGNPDYGQEQKTPAPSAMARNVGENPQATTAEGMATPGAVIKITDKDGKPLTTEPKEVKAGSDGKYTATIPLQADGTEIKVTAKLGEMGESDQTSTKVFDDKNDNKQPDRDEGFNIAKATDIKFVDQPDLTYLVATKDKEVTFDGKDGKGKPIYLELSYKNGDKTESKIMTLEDLMKDTENIAVTPAKSTKDKIGNDPANLVGKAIEVKLVKVDPATATSEATSTSKFDIEIDADGNGKADKDETTATPTVTARNIGTDNKTTVEGTAPKGSTVTIKYTPEGEQETTKTVTAGDDGKYTAEITPKLEAGKEVTVTAKDGEKKVSPEVKTQVFDDKDNDGKDDKSQNFDITKADKIEMVYDPAKMNYLVTSEDGKVALETKGMVVKVTDKAGVEKKFTAEEIAKDTKNFTVEPKEGTEIGLDNNGKPIKVTLNVKGATTKEATTSNLSVKLDANGNGIDDEKEKLDLAKVTGIKIIKQPQLNYPITTEGGKKNINLSDMVVELTDGVNKANYTAQELLAAKIGEGQAAKAAFKLELVKGSATAAPTTKDITSLNGIELTTANDGNKVEIALAAKTDVKTETEALQVFEDLDGDGKRDSKQTPAPKDLKALNKGNDTFTTITGKATKGGTLKVYGEDKKEIPVDQSNITIDENGNFTIKVSKDNKALDPNTTVFVTAQAKDKEESARIPVVVQVDKDGNGTADKDERTTIKSVIARNIGTGEPKVSATFTTIEGVAEPGSTVTIKFTPKAEEGQTATEVTKIVKADAQTGEYKLELKAGENELTNNILLPADTVVKAQAKFGDKKDSPTIETKVFDDLNADGKDDKATNQKTDRPTAKALNVGTDPKVTTITGKAEKGATVVAKVGDTIVGTTTADNKGDYKIEATKTGVADGGAIDKDTPVQVTAQVTGKLVSDPETAIVKMDKDGNGVADDEEQFNIKKATDVKILQNPSKMKYSVKTKDGKANFDASGLLIEVSDGSGKSKTYTYAEITSEDNKNNFTLSPADKAEIGLGENGADNEIPFKVTVTGADTQPTVTADEKVKVILDADGNGEHDKDETTTITSVIARNIGTGTTTPKTPATFTTIEGVAEKGSAVTITFTEKGKSEATTKTVEADKTTGAYKLELKGATEAENILLPADTEVKASAKFGDKKPSGEITTKVFEDLDADGKADNPNANKTERPSALAYNFKDEAKTTIKGDAEPGAKVIAKVGETKVGEATANSDGKYEISATKDNAKLPKGTKVSVTATLAPKGESPAQETVVYEDLDGDGQPDTSQVFDKDKIRGLEVVASPNKMVYNNKEKLDLSGMKVLLTDQMGNMKIVDFSEFETYGITVKPLNNIELSDKNVADGGHNGQKIKAEVKVTIGNNQETYSGETPTALEVNKDQSAQPTDVEAANQGTKTTTTVRGKATPGAKVEVKNANGQVIGTVDQVPANGEFQVEVTKQADKAKVKVTATESGKTESAPQEAKVFRDKDSDWKDDKGGKVEIEKPVVDPIKVGDESVKVKTPGEGITKITVKDEKGKTIDVVKDGNDWKVDGKPVEKDGTKLVIPTKDKGLDFGAYEKVEITNHDDEGNEGKIVVATKPANLKPMEKPTIDPISTQSTKITGKSLPGSKVLVYLPGDTDETAKEALVKSDGSYELTLATPLADKSLVKVKATNPQREGTGEAETKVGLNTKQLEDTKTEADGLINDSKTNNNFDPDNNKYDKNLEDKTKAAQEILERAKDNKDDNDPTQTQVNTAEKELRDAINQKNADDKVKVVEKAVKDGQKPSEDQINQAQEAIDKVTDPTAKKELQDRLDKAKALDELKDAKDDLDKVIDKAVEEKKPIDEIDKAKKESKKADEIINSGGNGKTVEDLVKEVESIKEMTKKLGQPAIRITIDSAINNSSDLILTTNPGRCKVNITIYYADGGEKEYVFNTDPNGVGSILLEKPLQIDDYIEVKATRKLKPTDKPDYLDNSTSTYVY